MTHPLPHQCAAPYCRRLRREEHPFCHRHEKQQWRSNHPVIATWRNLIDNAKRRKKEFSLTTADFIDFLEETAYMDLKGRWRLCLHMDRINNAKGYTRGNIQALTCTANTIKGNQERRPTCPF